MPTHYTNEGKNADNHAMDDNVAEIKTTTPPRRATEDKQKEKLINRKRN